MEQIFSKLIRKLIREQNLISPDLFIIYINGILKEIYKITRKRSMSFGFVDDIAVRAIGKQTLY